MPRRAQIPLEPRKSPVQERSAASVDAILEATIQVLLQVGKERLTTTKVAARAGVSVGTLYQYFPNKSALLQAVLKKHFAGVVEAVELACEESKGQSLRQMATALVTAFLDAKLKDVRTSVALHAVSDDVEGSRIVQDNVSRINRAVGGMLETARERLTTDRLLVTLMLQGVMSGIGRRIVESDIPERQIADLRRELIFLVCTYLEASSEHVADEVEAAVMIN